MDNIMGMDMFKFLEAWLQNDNTKVIYLLVLILIANMIDFLLGWVNAKLNKEVPFVSGKAIMGIARKLVLFILLVYFIPVAMLVPEPVGVGAIFVLYIGYLFSEINSILSHLKLTDDDKDNVFYDFIETLIHKKGGKNG